MYFNTLIIMNEDTLGYGNRSRKPSGYCKLTMPNKIICYAQGLRQLPEGQVYRLYLTSKARDQGIEVGMFQVGASGNKETRWLMDPSSINNSGIGAKEIDGALIKVDGDGVKDQIVPLVGFSTEAYRWEHLIKSEPTQEKETQTEEESLSQEPQAEEEESLSQEPQAEPEEIHEELMEKPTEEKKPEQDQLTLLKEEIEKLKKEIQAFKVLIEGLKRGIEDKDDEKLVPREEAETEETEIEADKIAGINDYINNFIKKFQAAEKTADKTDRRTAYKANQKEAQNIFEMRIPINPFEAQNTGIKWVRITYEDLAALPSLDREWINQAFIKNAHRDYKHFILGKDQAGLSYYLGIPGIFDPNKENGLNISKIEKFSCCHNLAPRTGEAGYWLARI